VLLLSLGEYRLMERLLFASEYHTNFVLLNIEGVVTGHPIGRAFQNRLLGPYIVKGIAQLMSSSLFFALKLYTLLMVTVGNLLLGGLLYHHFRKMPSDRTEYRAILIALTAVALFGLLRLLLLYYLEYPWDYIDALLFMLFGYWVVVRQPKWLLLLLFLTALLNRESCLFILLWFMLESIWGTNRPSFAAKIEGGSPLKRIDWRKFFLAGLTFLGTVIIIYGIREWLFIAPTPVEGLDLDVEQLGNNWNLAHNVNQFLLYNWRSTLLFINLALLTAVVFLALIFRRYPVAAIWTVCWIASIFAFGFINETRLYIPLIAFWIVYLPISQWPQISP
jgi:hypothetical protein